LTLSGDTYFTLRDADPILPNPESMKDWSSAYANPSEQRIPYASPVYGNFSKGFLTTLIEVGTKEVRLSDSSFISSSRSVTHPCQTRRLRRNATCIAILSLCYS
jgi:hypothetical protein